MDEITAIKNDRGNFDVTIPNLGYRELKIQLKILNNLCDKYPKNENLAVMADILAETISTIKRVKE